MEMDTYSVRGMLKLLRKQFSPVSDSAWLDAQLLIAHCLGKSREWVLTYPEAMISSDARQVIFQSADKVANGVPLPYILRYQEFYGLRFAITPSVLIPRPETELMIDQAINWLMANPDRRNTIDIGTGSGIIAVALAKHIPDLNVVAIDTSFPALEIARKNSMNHLVEERIQFINCNLFHSIFGKFDMICANLPYIPTNLLRTLDVCEREPTEALDGGETGLKYIAKLLLSAKNHLIPGGILFAEIGSTQGDDVMNLANAAFNRSLITVLKDLSGLDRLLVIQS
jgi:release factor glutamine methyltransferase